MEDSQMLFPAEQPLDDLFADDGFDVLKTHQKKNKPRHPPKAEDLAHIRALQAQQGKPCLIVLVTIPLMIMVKMVVKKMAVKKMVVVALLLLQFGLVINETLSCQKDPPLLIICRSMG